MSKSTTRVSPAPPAEQKPIVRHRDAAKTRLRLLDSALTEFCEFGFNGARTARIAERAECNIRMLYHYFESKEGIYLASLEQVYKELREQEAKLTIDQLDPALGILALVEFTFDHMQRHPEFIRMIGIENIQHARFLKASKIVPEGAQPLIRTISKVLKRGEREGLFKKNVDPVQLYVSILSLNYIHISNKYTLSVTFGRDLGDKKWLIERRRHVCDVVLGYLRCE